MDHGTIGAARPDAGAHATAAAHAAASTSQSRARAGHSRTTDSAGSRPGADGDVDAHASASESAAATPERAAVVGPRSTLGAIDYQWGSGAAAQDHQRRTPVATAGR